MGEQFSISAYSTVQNALWMEYVLGFQSTFPCFTTSSQVLNAYEVKSYLPTLPIFAGVSRKSTCKRGGAYANTAQKWAFPELLGRFQGWGKNLPYLGGKKVGKYELNV